METPLGMMSHEFSEISWTICFLTKIGHSKVAHPTGPTRLGEKAHQLRGVGCYRAFMAHPGTESRLGVDVIPLRFRARRVD